MAIPASQARALYTQLVADMLIERTKVMSFLRSFFPTKESVTKYVTIEVQRGTEKVAVDVTRGSQGNYNKVSKSTEKIFEPPYFREWINATELDLYDLIAGDGTVSEAQFTQFLESMAEKLQMLIAKIERAYELQCSQVLETGIITVADGTNIDFKRKAAHLVDKGGGNYWATSGVSPFTDIEAGCVLIRQNGKAQGGVFNAIFGSTAWQHFLDNDKVLGRAAIQNWSLTNVREPQRDSVGGTLHGRITCGSYEVNLWTYPEYYDNSSNASTPYLNAKKVIVLPENPRFKLAFAAVPQIAGSGALKKGAYVIGEKKDDFDGIHKMDVKSAGVAIPTAVDEIYTVQVVA